MTTLFLSGMTQSCQPLHVILGLQHCPVFLGVTCWFFIEVVFTQVANQNNFAVQYRDIGTLSVPAGAQELQPRGCSPCLPLQPACVLSCCFMYSVQNIFMAVLTTHLDYKGCSLAMFGLLQFPSEFTQLRL